jgi:uncharacterized membrane protein YqjE
MRIAVWIFFYVLTFPILLFINWMLWFRLLPTLFRHTRDQLRRRRER